MRAATNLAPAQGLLLKCNGKPGRPLWFHVGSTSGRPPIIGGVTETGGPTEATMRDMRWTREWLAAVPRREAAADSESAVHADIKRGVWTR